MFAMRICALTRREPSRPSAPSSELDVDEVVAAVEGGERLPLGHKLAGNQMLRESTFVFEPERVAGRALPWPYALLTWVLTWPLLLRYGYAPTGRCR